MKILVTGAAGFIGFHLSKALLKQGFKVVGIDNINDYYSVKLKCDRLKELGVVEIGENTQYKSNKHTNFQFYKIDIIDKEKVNRLFENEKFDIIVNLAAQAGVRYSLEYPHEYVNSNIIGFLNVLEACKQYKVDKILYASSSSVYGKNIKQPFSVEDKTDSPISMYAVTKKTNELMAHAYSNLFNIQTIGLRFFTVYGPWGRPDMAPFLFADSILNGNKVNVFNNGEMKRDFTYIDDIINGMILLIEKNIEEKYKVFNIGNSKPIDLMYFIRNLETNLNRKAFFNFKEMQLGDLKETWADIDDLQKEVEFRPTMNVEDGVKIFATWYKDYYGY